MTTAAVATEGLSAGYGGRPVLRDVSFAAGPGQTVCVLGPNGGGKTTLFRALIGELEPLAGHLRLSGRPAYVAQTERTRLDFPVSALDVALMGGARARALVAAAAPRPTAPPRAAALERVGLAARGATPASASSRAVSASAPCWRARSSRTLPCCCSTSRSPGSTRRAPS